MMTPTELAPASFLPPESCATRVLCRTRPGAKHVRITRGGAAIELGHGADALSFAMKSAGQILGTRGRLCGREGKELGGERAHTGTAPRPGGWDDEWRPSCAHILTS